jgi:cell division protein FtsW (lipid II flippase)
MTAGIITLAVPGSTMFAGEFLVLLGVFKVGWGWAVAGAFAIVLAAMYALRLISAVLHRERGSAVPDGALDLRPGEVVIIVPLLACLIGLSFWPAAITERSFFGDSAKAAVQSQFNPVVHLAAPGATYNVTQAQIAVGTGGLPAMALSPTCQKQMRAALAKVKEGDPLLLLCSSDRKLGK